MKKLFVLASLMSIFSLAASAQDSTSAAGRQDNRQLKAAYKGAKRDKKEKMKALNLTADQKKEMKENRSELKAKYAAIDKDQSLTEEQRNEQKAALKKEQRTATQAMLTPEQKTTIAEEKKKSHQEAKAHAEQRMDNMKTELSLSDNQVSQLKALEMSNHSKMKAIKKDNSMDAATRKSEIDELKKAADDKRKTILTADQLKKMEATKDQRMTGNKRLKS